MARTLSHTPCGRHKWMAPYPGTVFFQQLIKFDFLKNKVTLWSDERYAPGEPIFVAKPAATAEDDGKTML